MRFFGILCHFKRHGVIRKIGTGVLPNHVQKQIIDCGRQIIMMRHVAAGPCFGIGLVQPPPDMAHSRQNTGRGWQTFCMRAVAHGNAKQSLHIIAFNRQRAVHVSLAQGQFGVAHQPAGCGLILDAHGNLWPVPITKADLAAVTDTDHKVAFADQPTQKTYK